jgi:hypothetical protein
MKNSACPTVGGLIHVTLRAVPLCCHCEKCCDDAIYRFVGTGGVAASLRSSHFGRRPVPELK